MGTCGRYIDLNADLGEADDPNALIADRAIMPAISSCNIACGGHIGNDETMRATLELASEHDVAAGAHPSYPDRANFGRKSMDITLPELLNSLVAQISSLIAIADALKLSLHHIKPHGALYNDLARDSLLADAVAACFARAFPDLALVGLAGGALENAAQKARISYIREAFVDRRYLENGHLQPRNMPGSVLTEKEDQAKQAVDIVLHQQVRSAKGELVRVHAQTLCLHGDTEGAANNAANVRKALELHNISIKRWQV